MFAVPESGSVVTGCAGQLFRGIGSEVHQRITFEVPPKHFGRIDFRRIGWKKEPMELGRAHKHMVNRGGTVGLRPIPYNEEGFLHLAAEGAEKRHYSFCINVFSGIERKVKSYPLTPWRDRQCCDSRNFAMSPTNLMEDGRLSAGSPSAPYQGREQEPAFVYESDGSFQCAGFFLMWGHSTFIQRRMAFSSRSRASRSGFCGVQPREWRNRPIWSTWYVT